eukprot:428453-Amphidinium_carterae.1
MLSSAPNLHFTRTKVPPLSSFPQHPSDNYESSNRGSTSGTLGCVHRWGSILMGQAVVVFSVKNLVTDTKMLITALRKSMQCPC